MRVNAGANQCVRWISDVCGPGREGRRASNLAGSAVHQSPDFIRSIVLNLADHGIGFLGLLKFLSCT